MRREGKPVTWILVANSARAILLDDQGADNPLTVIKVFRDPSGRKSASELVTDRPGRGQSPTGTGAALAPHTSPHRNAQEHFAAHLATILADSRVRDMFSRLVVVAANPFYGVLLSHLDPHVRKMVSRTVERDFCDVPLTELRERLAAA